MRQSRALTLLLKWLALCGGVGRLPLAPGTWASLISLVGWYALSAAAPAWLYFVVWLALSAVGLAATRAYLADTTEPDPREVVIDEVSGMGLALFLLPAAWPWALAAFVLFRILDIWKPWIVGAIDRSFHGALGVMADDIAAGVLVCLILHLARFLLHIVV